MEIRVPKCEHKFFLNGSEFRIICGKCKRRFNLLDIQPQGKLPYNITYYEGTEPWNNQVTDWENTIAAVKEIERLRAIILELVKK